MSLRAVLDCAANRNGGTNPTNGKLILWIPIGQSEWKDASQLSASLGGLAGR